MSYLLSFGEQTQKRREEKKRLSHHKEAERVVQQSIATEKEKKKLSPRTHMRMPRIVLFLSFCCGYSNISDPAPAK